MTFHQFNALVSAQPRPVILLEGTREVPDDVLHKLTGFATWLATKYPHAIFRSGNAKGSDEAFAAGVTAVDPGRLELLLPVAGHRAKYNPTEYPVRSVGLDQLSKAAEGDAAWITRKASTQYESLMEKRDKVPRLRAKANYLICDTAKVTGIPEADFAKADFGIFYVNTADPMKGGTGHTIRVCRSLSVPVIFQDEWLGWMADA